MLERRTRRSSLPREAVSLLLEAAATRSGAQATALADHHGLLVGGAGHACDLEQLAALGTHRARLGPDPSPSDEFLETFTCGEDLYASPIGLGRDVYYLISLGARVRRHRDIEAGLLRILAVS